ncbi:uncharacterized protein HD556DRAFT_1310910 [Suillus plorans]|uniref:Uncharacterized protein n=1 Tax=Suillus plorans TaxID=116603 RepID=A0A9P7AJH0_9AGAM|nr:uncharacterized protein HD556DRAFT_1310910 [Suillus plorans]KAG1790126.1 hypothetical protein HD556DRAFT_1310910 [Suillus plorans]
MSTFLEGLGMPNLFLELQGLKGDRPLWIADIVSSQEEEEMVSIAQHYTECQDVILVSIIDIRKSAPYKSPEYSPDTAKAQIGLNATTTDTSHLDLLLERGMKAIHNSIVDYVVQHCQPMDNELSSIRQWTPPARIFDWDQVMKYICKAALRDGYSCYCQWHDTTKRNVDEITNPESQGESNKRPKRA